MRWVRVVPVAGAVIVLIAAAIAYEQFIPIHHEERARLSRLVVARPPAGFATKSTSSNEVVSSSSPFSAFKTAAKRSPNQTGAYSIQWPEASSTANAASVLVSWLPSASDAAGVEKQAVSSYLTSGSFKSDSYTMKGRFSIPAVAGAQAATFGPAPSKGSQGLAVAVFPEGRFVVVDFAQQAGAAQAQATVISLSQAQAAHLRQIGSGFTLGVTTYPAAASLIFGGVAVALAALVVAVPVGVSRGRRRRRAARDLAARRAVQGRGRKIAKHHAARSR